MELAWTAVLLRVKTDFRQLSTYRTSFQSNLPPIFERSAADRLEAAVLACSRVSLTSLPAPFPAVSTWCTTYHSRGSTKQCEHSTLKVNSSAEDHERNATLSLQQIDITNPVFAENLIGLGYLWPVSYTKPTPIHEKTILLWEKVAQMPTLASNFSWVGLLAFGWGVRRFHNNSCIFSNPA